MRPRWIVAGLLATALGFSVWMFPGIRDEPGTTVCDKSGARFWSGIAPKEVAGMTLELEGLSLGATFDTSLVPRILNGYLFAEKRVTSSWCPVAVLEMARAGRPARFDASIRAGENQYAVDSAATQTFDISPLALGVYRFTKVLQRSPRGLPISVVRVQANIRSRS